MAAAVVKQDKPADSQSMMTFIIALALVSVLAVGAGWFVGAKLLPPRNADLKIEEKTGTETKAGDTKEEAENVPAGKTIVALGPIIVGLSGSQNTWLRIEMAVVADGDADLKDPVVKGRIASDIAAFLRNITLSQISGPSGFLHLKDDLLDRARLSTDGKVDDVMISTLVVE